MLRSYERSPFVVYGHLKASRHTTHACKALTSCCASTSRPIHAMLACKVSPFICKDQL